MSRHCVVLVSDKAYLTHLLQTLTKLRTVGDYHDTIVVIRGTDWNETNDAEFLAYKATDPYDLRVLEFPEIDTQYIRKVYAKHPYCSPFNCRRHKLFQLHKFYLFSSFVKEWDVILYIDANMKIHRSIHDVWNLDWKNKFISYDETIENPTWKLSGQFHTDKKHPDTAALLKDFNLHTHYFQSSFILFDTSIVTEQTVPDLIHYMNKYPTAITNDQAIMSLYFHCHHKLYVPLTAHNPIFHYYYNPSLKHIFSKK